MPQVQLITNGWRVHGLWKNQVPLWCEPDIWRAESGAVYGFVALLKTFCFCWRPNKNNLCVLNIGLVQQKHICLVLSDEQMNKRWPCYLPKIQLAGGWAWALSRYGEANRGHFQPTDTPQNSWIVFSLEKLRGCSITFEGNRSRCFSICWSWYARGFLLWMSPNLRGG